MLDLNAVKDYAIKCHQDTNHLYDDKPYSFHLEMVFAIGKQSSNCLSTTLNKEQINNTLAALWCHDLIEDARQSYNDVAKATNKEIAEIVYKVTTMKGRTRDERASDEYYKEIATCKSATFVKICNRIANISYSKTQNSSMNNVYWTETPHFIHKLYHPIFENLLIKMMNVLYGKVRLDENNNMYTYW